MSRWFGRRPGTARLLACAILLSICAPTIAEELPPPRGARARLGTRNVSAVTCVAFSRDGKLLAVSRWKRPVEIYDVAGAKSIGGIGVRDSPVRGAAFSPEADRLYTIAGNRVRTWDFPSQSDAWVGEHEGALALVMTADGSRVVTGGSDGVIRVWNADHGELEYVLEGHEAEVYDVAMAADGRTIASCSRDCTIRLWPIDSDYEPKVVLLWGPDAVWRLGRSGDDFDPKNILRRSGPEIGSVDLSPLDDVVASAGLRIRVHSVSSGRQVQEIGRVQGLDRPDGLSIPGADIEFSRDGGLLVWSNGGGVLRLSELATGQAIGGWGLDGRINDLCLSPDGRTLACGMADSTVILWDLGDLLGGPRAASGLDGLWGAMASDDPADAYAATLAMATRGADATSYLGKTMLASPRSGGQVQDDIANLDADDQQTREAASVSVESRGPAVLPELHKALDTAGSPERRARLQELVRAVELPSLRMSGELRRRFRGVLALQWIGTEESRAVLSRVAGEGVWETEAAWARRALGPRRK